MIILMVSDFFYPNVGGVEQHMFQLSQFLLRRGHKVVVMTHAYEDRYGIRYMTNGLKVYYIPLRPFRDSNTWPTLFTNFPMVRDIIIREKIDIVHCHQAFSNLAHEAILHAGTMGKHTVFTDHSLFGFADASGILMNKLLKFTLSDIDHVICVSHIGKENTVLRARLNPSDVSVIPNAVDTQKFTPADTPPSSGGGGSGGPSSTLSPNSTNSDPLSPSFGAAASTERSSFGSNSGVESGLGETGAPLTIVILSRLVYRKGIDLVPEVLTQLCERHKDIKFVIGGDGPKKLLLEETVEKYQLHDRVEFLGSVPSQDVRDVLCRGHIFLNCSLTEAFCIAILEAAACGLLVVATKVGGVPEVLPPDMVIFAQPNSAALVAAVEKAIPRVRSGMVDPHGFHRRVASMYSWSEVAERTERVYQRVYGTPKVPLIERFRRYYGCGPVAGKLFVVVTALDHLLWRFLEWLRPADEIDIAIDYPRHSMAQ